MKCLFTIYIFLNQKQLGNVRIWKARYTQNTHLSIRYVSEVHYCNNCFYKGSGTVLSLSTLHIYLFPHNNISQSFLID
ncbi:unnamed protein product [Phytomonas sp. Hart1]|nr:unnamed protein product [Phytomonas sp. Hart1]|eukprot:CCW65977.1 unnamed protein product [Phytomonas sp. isolate Hart1]